MQIIGYLQYIQFRITKILMNTQSLSGDYCKQCTEKEEFTSFPKWAESLTVDSFARKQVKNV